MTLAFPFGSWPGCTGLGARAGQRPAPHPRSAGTPKIRLKLNLQAVSIKKKYSPKMFHFNLGKVKFSEFLIIVGTAK